MVKNLGIFWFRQDLRLRDNIALNKLIDKCDKIIPIYILDEDFKLGGASKWWLHHSLMNLNNSLIEKKSQLYCFRGKPIKILKTLVSNYKVNLINWNRLYDKYSIDRDKFLKVELNKNKVNVCSYNGSLINEPWSIKNKSGSFFKVFTPYWNQCLEEIRDFQLTRPKNKFKTLILNKSDYLTVEKLKIHKNSKWEKVLSLYWSPGESKAIKNLNYFKNNIIDRYEEGRDRPDKNYTSKLSPHIHFGEISPVRIFLEVQNKKNSKLISKKKFLSEIGWREFSYNLLFNYPNIRTKAIQEKFNKFPWEKNSKYLKAWKNGTTGYPIVDAGMRQLYKTGWMHNRVRMIVGSFLCKNLLIHWWEGEKWFFDTLVDADLGSNSAGWQWIAGCGADAAPYFRIFNPITQGLKFDPNGEYVKNYIPELRNISSEFIHAPWKLSQDEQLKYKCIIGKNYPKPIVDLSESRDKALKAFGKLKSISE